MGVRVRVVLVVLSLLAIAALAVPLGLTLADRRTATLAAERSRQLSSLADSIARPGADPGQLVDRYYDVYGEGLLVVDSDGLTEAAHGLSMSDPAVASAAARALVAAPSPGWTRILPWDRRPVPAAVGVRRNGELVGAVVVDVDTAAAARDVTIAWLWVSAGCVVLLVLAVVAARVMTRWVLRPMDGLERAVAEMAEGVAGPPANVAGPPELRHFTGAFNTMAQGVRSSIDRQRRLVADASHQLRNPLAAVRLRADNLQDYVSEDGAQTHASLTAELDRLENLLEQMLRLARAEEAAGSRRVGLANAAPESTDLDDLIRQRISFWQPVADGHHQRLGYCSDQPGNSVRLARHDVEQLVDVALDNALRYGGPNTTVTLATASSGGMIELVVSDNGPGLPDEELARAATRFWRGHDDGVGTGLGLAIAGEIASGHGGTISVERASEGGLLIRYRLPPASVPA
jgi:signal transduction histidine kinase